MNVAYVYFTYKGRSGTERYSIHLLDELKKMASKSNIRILELPIKKIERSVLGLPFGGNISLFVQSMLKFPQADIVHSTSPEVITHKTNVVTVHDIFPLKYPETFSQTFFRKLSNELIFKRIRSVEKIIAVSKSTAKDLMEILDVDEDKISVIYEGVDFTKFYPDRNVPRELDKEKTSLLLVGDLNPRKKYEIVFDAVQDLEDVIVYHIGTRNNWEARWRQIEKISKRHSNKIKLLGPKSDDELRRWLSNVDFFVFPSMDEGFGIPCLPPDTPIITLDGAKPIEEVKIGDLVLTHRSRFMKVTKTMRRFYKGNIAKLVVWSHRGLELRLTPEHPVLAIKRPKKRMVNGKTLSLGHILTKGDVKIEWISASKLNKGDIVLFPVVRQSFSTKVIDLHELLSREGIDHEYDDNYVWLKTGYRPDGCASYSRIAELAGVDINVVKYIFEDLIPKGKEPKQKRHRKVLEVARELGYIKSEPKKYFRYIKDLKKFARLLGYYTAKGLIISNGHAVELNFRLNDSDLINDVKNIVKELFNDEVIIYEQNSNNSVRVVLCGILYVALVKQCGVGAHNKRIPPWILYGSTDVLNEFLDAYIKGDRCTIKQTSKNKGSLVVAVTTVSPELAIDLKIALTRLGYKPRVSAYSRKRKNKEYIEYQVKTVEDNVGIAHSNKSCFIKGKYIGFLVDDVIIENYEGYVYNLEVEDDNSYTTAICTVHNCIEAMACGTNVILSDIPTFREIAGEYAAAYFQLNVESFIKAVESAQKNKKPSEKLIQYARKFTWERAAKETLKVYESLL